MYRIRGDYLIRQIVGEWIVIAVGGDIAQTRVFLSLNDSGALLWKTLQSGADVRMLASALADAYGIERARAEMDAETFIRQLLDGGIAEPV